MATKKQTKVKTFDQVIDAAIKNMNAWPVDDLVSDVLESDIVDRTLRNIVRTKIKAVLAAKQK